ncbi:MAG: hypothetical protein IJP42_09995 [Selenomonadaceae bacterium]|nr:hypothetical protein [Selenomonadaceae bacterium]MBR0060473.1 hypothetical protein [Selenomonadaceae bacterium]
MTTVLGKTIVAPPNVGSTQTFTSVGAFDTEQEAINCDKYLNTKFCRIMLSMLKVTQHNSPATWAMVPMQDFTAESDIDWSKPLPVIDQQLYHKYGLDFAERYFIESMIEYRKDLPAEYFGEYYVVIAGSRG